MEKGYIEKQYYLLPYSQPYWSEIKEGLVEIAKSSKLEITINYLLKFHSLTRGTEYKKFNQLYKVPKTATLKTFASMATFVLDLEEYYTANPKRLPLFTKHNYLQHTFEKTDVVLMMCILALCISTNAKVMNQKFKTSLSSLTDCAGIYAMYQRKIPFLLAYFDRVFEEMKTELVPMMTIHRFRVISLRSKDILNNNDPLGLIEIARDEQSLDGWQKDTRVKVDFANRYISGGTLNRGCVQEQIMFLNHTEACISALLCEPMLDNEAIGLHGFKKYFKNTGYSTTTQFDGDEDFPYTMDEEHHLNDYLIAIDALPKQKNKNQYSPDMVLRQINKCLAGFSIFEPQLRISTGNWGCGVFKGDVQLKFIIQWIAASICKRVLVYYPYGNKNIKNASQIITKLQTLSISKVFKLVLEYPINSKLSVFEYIQKALE